MTSITLDRNECRTAMELRRMACAKGWHSTNWRYIGAKLAAQYGYIVVWLADDTMVEFSLENGTVRRKTHKPNAWRFNSLTLVVELAS